MNWPTCLCGKACGKTKRGNTPLKHCGAEVCRKAYDAARKRALRASKGQAAPEIPVGAAEPSKRLSCLVETPWGVTYGSETEAWGDVLLSGGVGAEFLTEAERFSRIAALAELTGYRV